jgi:hypothetical protein
MYLGSNFSAVRKVREPFPAAVINATLSNSEVGESAMVAARAES